MTTFLEAKDRLQRAGHFEDAAKLDLFRRRTKKKDAAGWDRYAQQFSVDAQRVIWPDKDLHQEAGE